MKQDKNLYFGHHRPQNAFFQVNSDLLNLMNEMNATLASAEKALPSKSLERQWPVLFFAGTIRSGSTLFMQWLAQSGQWAYPSNLLSRFYQAPGMGAKIQQLLFHPDYQVGNEFQDLQALKLNYSSNLGKTGGVLSPNSFIYFWRKHFPFQGGDWISREALEQADESAFVQALAELESVFQKPFAIKAQILNYHLDYLNKIVPHSLFFQIRRDPVQVASSILNARRLLYDDAQTWFSFQIDEYDELKDCSPYIQVAGQIFYTQKAMDQGLKKIPKAQQIQFDYEDFCRNPAQAYAQIQQYYADHGYALADYQGPEFFEPSRKVLDPSERKKIEQALRHFGL